MILDDIFDHISCSIAYPTALPDKLDFDDQNHVLLKFKVLDSKTSSPIAVHQAFLYFTSKVCSDLIDWFNFIMCAAVLP